MGHAPLAIWPAEAPEGVFFLGCCCLFRCELSEGGVILGNIPGHRGGSRWGSLDLAFLPAYFARRGPHPPGAELFACARSPDRPTKCSPKKFENALWLSGRLSPESSEFSNSQLSESQRGNISRFHASFTESPKLCFQLFCLSLL